VPDFIGGDPESNASECPAVFVIPETGDFVFRGKTQVKEHRLLDVLIARVSVQSTATHAASTTFDRRVTPPAEAARSPSGSRPRSAGRPRTSRLSGASRTNVTTPSVKQAVRQPPRSMRTWSHGNRMIEPTPTPENAMLMARPRRRTNQFGR